MGFLSLLLKPFLYSILIFVGFLGLLTFAPGLPPHLDFSPYTITPVSSRVQKLLDKGKEKAILDSARVLVNSSFVEGPDAPVLRNGFLYVGDRRGLIQRIHPKTGEVTSIAQLCNKDQGHCTWAAGSDVDVNGKLVTADIFGGLMRIDLDTGASEVLVPGGTVINGKPVRFPDAVTVAQTDGSIYWTDVTEFTLENCLAEFLGSTPTGRVLHYNPVTKETKEIMSNLHLANGIQLSKDEDFFVVVETIRSRILRYYLKGTRMGQSDVFVDGLPGVPDNIRPNGKNGFYVSMFSKRQEVDLGECPKVRRFQARLFYVIRTITSMLHYVLPNYVTPLGDMDLMEWMLSLEFISKGERAIILEIDEKGQVIHTLQSSNSDIRYVSQITVDPDGEEVYFASPFLNKIWAIRKDVLSS